MKDMTRMRDFAFAFYKICIVTFHNCFFVSGEVACKVVNGLPLFSITSSIYTLILMSVERYRAIVIGSSDPAAKVGTNLQSSCSA